MHGSSYLLLTVRPQHGSYSALVVAVVPNPTTEDEARVVKPKRTHPNVAAELRVKAVAVKTGLSKRANSRAHMSTTAPNFASAVETVLPDKSTTSVQLALSQDALTVQVVTKTQATTGHHLQSQVKESCVRVQSWPLVSEAVKD